MSPTGRANARPATSAVMTGSTTSGTTLTPPQISLRSSGVIRHQFVLRPTLFCSQRTNRNRANQRAAILNNEFTSCCAQDIALLIRATLVARQLLLAVLTCSASFNMFLLQAI